MPFALLLKFAPLLLSALNIFDRTMAVIPANGEKTTIMVLLKTIVIPLLATRIPGFQEQMASLALDSAVDLLTALFAAHSAAKVFKVRLEAVVQK
jgi:hypothetical protein